MSARRSSSPVQRTTKRGQNIALLETGDTFSQASAALCVPLGLRHLFRRIARMDENLYPQNAKVMQDFFSKCRLCRTSKGVNNVAKPECLLEWENEKVGWEEDTERCMAWVKKNLSMNNNMYFWINGKNTSVRRLMFEWFVGPTELTEEEKNTFQKKRCRLRKKPRRIHSSCSFTNCVNPAHLGAIPSLSKTLQKKIEEERAQLQIEIEIDQDQEHKDSFSLSPQRKSEEEETAIFPAGAQEPVCTSMPEWPSFSERLAKEALLRANDTSVSILERTGTLFKDSAGLQWKRHKRTYSVNDMESNGFYVHHVDALCLRPNREDRGWGKKKRRVSLCVNTLDAINKRVGRLYT